MGSLVTATVHICIQLREILTSDAQLELSAYLEMFFSFPLLRQHM